jgi:hypothetical protein
MVGRCSMLLRCSQLANDPALADRGGHRIAELHRRRNAAWALRTFKGANVVSGRSQCDPSKNHAGLAIRTNHSL